MMKAIACMEISFETHGEYRNNDDVLRWGIYEDIRVWYAWRFKVMHLGVTFSKAFWITCAAVRVPSASSSFNATNAGLLEMSVISILSSSAIMAGRSPALRSSALQPVLSKSQITRLEQPQWSSRKKEWHTAESLRSKGSPSKPRRMLEYPPGEAWLGKKVFNGWDADSEHPAFQKIGV